LEEVIVHHLLPIDEDSASIITGGEEGRQAGGGDQNLAGEPREELVSRVKPWLANGALFPPLLLEKLRFDCPPVVVRATVAGVIPLRSC
jgi:hypothetical protein